MFKLSCRFEDNTLHFCCTKTNQLIMFRQSVAVYNGNERGEEKEKLSKKMNKDEEMKGRK